MSDRSGSASGCRTVVGAFLSANGSARDVDCGRGTSRADPGGRGSCSRLASCCCGNRSCRHRAGSGGGRSRGPCPGGNMAAGSPGCSPGTLRGCSGNRGWGSCGHGHGAENETWSGTVTWSCRDIDRRGKKENRRRNEIKIHSFYNTQRQETRKDFSTK